MTDDRHIPLAILRRKQVEARTGLSRSALYDKLNLKSPRHDSSFPVQVRLGADAVGWLESEVDAWLASRPRVREINQHEAPETKERQLTMRSGRETAQEKRQRVDTHGKLHHRASIVTQAAAE